METNKEFNERVNEAITALNTLIQSDEISKNTKDLLKLNRFKQYLFKLKK